MYLIGYFFLSITQNTFKNLKPYKINIFLTLLLFRFKNSINCLKNKTCTESIQIITISL